MIRQMADDIITGAIVAEDVLRDKDEELNGFYSELLQLGVQRHPQPPVKEGASEGARAGMAKEFYSTETNYLKKLKVFENYRSHLGENWAGLGFTSMKEAESLTPDVTDLIRQSELLLGKLQQNPASPSQLAEVFLETVNGHDHSNTNKGNSRCEWPFARKFIDFINKTDKARRLLREKKNQALADMLATCDDEIRNQTGLDTTLKNLLMEPIQRVSRYPLLFETLLINTPPTHPDRELLRQSHEKARLIADAVDANEREMAMKTFNLHFSNALGRKQGMMATASAAFVMEFEVQVLDGVGFEDFDSAGEGGGGAEKDERPVYLLVFTTRVVVLRRGVRRGKEVDLTRGGAYELVCLMELKGTGVFEVSDTDIKIVRDISHDKTQQSHPDLYTSTPQSSLTSNRLQILVLRTSSGTQRNKLLRVMRHTLVQHEFDNVAGGSGAANRSQLYVGSAGSFDLYYCLRTVVGEGEGQQGGVKEGKRASLISEHPALVVCKDEEFVRTVAQTEGDKHHLLGVLQCLDQRFRTSLRRRDDLVERDTPTLPEKMPGWVDLQHLMEELCGLLKSNPLTFTSHLQTTYDNESQLLLFFRKFPLHTWRPSRRHRRKSILPGAFDTSAPSTPRDDNDKRSTTSSKIWKKFTLGRGSKADLSPDVEKSSMLAEGDRSAPAAEDASRRGSVDVTRSGTMGRSSESLKGLGRELSFYAPSVRTLRRPGAIRRESKDSPIYGQLEQGRAMDVDGAQRKPAKGRDVSKAESALQRLKSRMGLRGGDDKEARGGRSILPEDVLCRLIDIIESRGINEHGIYRTSGVATFANDLAEQLFDSPGPTLKKLQNPKHPIPVHEVVSILKKYIASPKGYILIPAPAQSEILAQVEHLWADNIRPAEADMVPALRYATSQTMNPNQIKVLGTFLEHLSRISLKESTNGMSVENLARVLTPTLFTALIYDQNKVQHAINAMESLIWLGKEISHSPSSGEGPEGHSGMRDINSNVTDAASYMSNASRAYHRPASSVQAAKVLSKGLSGVAGSGGFAAGGMEAVAVNPLDVLASAAASKPKQLGSEKEVEAASVPEHPAPPRVESLESLHQQMESYRTEATGIPLPKSPSPEAEATLLLLPKSPLPESYRMEAASIPLPKSPSPQLGLTGDRVSVPHEDSLRAQISEKEKTLEELRMAVDALKEDVKKLEDSGLLREGLTKSFSETTVQAVGESSAPTGDEVGSAQSVENETADLQRRNESLGKDLFTLTAEQTRLTNLLSSPPVPTAAECTSSPPKPNETSNNFHFWLPPSKQPSSPQFNVCFEFGTDLDLKAGLSATSKQEAVAGSNETVAEGEVEQNQV
ncbi:hypothetical protein HK097_000396 [Rhizophlyctis rosea]|uniref:Uncharacterized protein n=1 Tax=Rhizophlyctis rosea TaxID=64517 RepID=A0AAD5S854_9FUNG|nr:hypothetical protein HK097_000396 [Rhizophlyctis rosea]